jgi:hypothetical protein
VGGPGEQAGRRQGFQLGVDIAEELVTGLHLEGVRQGLGEEAVGVGRVVFVEHVREVLLAHFPLVAASGSQENQSTRNCCQTCKTF